MVGFLYVFWGEDSPQVLRKDFFLGGGVGMYCLVWNVYYIPGAFAKCFRVNRSMVGLSEQTAS